MLQSSLLAGPVLVASWNGGPATARAVALYREGVPLLDAIVRGIAIVEDDPTEMSVGYGGLPNEEGEVELDAAVMDGPRHKAGAVAGLRGVRHASAVALEVLRRTDHALLVGEGAAKFARQCGFRSEDLVTPQARSAWLAWKAQLSDKDAWIHEHETTQFDTARWAGERHNPTPGKPPEVPFTFGTIHVSGVDTKGDCYAVTSTSGLSYKLPGRVGDTPIVGAGLYADNAVGCAGATGRGEASMQNCAAFDVVRRMESGATPSEACEQTLQRLMRSTREKRLHDSAGNPSFNVTLYAVRKDGLVGSASIHPGYTFVKQMGDVTTLEKAPSLLG